MSTTYISKKICRYIYNLINILDLPSTFSLFLRTRKYLEALFLFIVYIYFFVTFKFMQLIEHRNTGSSYFCKCNFKQIVQGGYMKQYNKYGNESITSM